MPPGEPAPRPGRRGEAGYNLVILVVAITVLSIMVAVALPTWSSVIRRDREEELIFRGFQYVEAIRSYHKRFHNYPVRLAQLLETSPRYIRQLWKDPMTEDGKWRLLFQNGPGVPLQKQAEGGPDDNGGGKGGSEAGKQDIDPVGPIIGVASRSSKESFLTFNGRQHYDEWEFTENLLTGVISNGSAAVPGGGGRAQQLNVRWIGRPLPQDLVPPGGNVTVPPGAGGPGGPGGPGGKGGGAVGGKGGGTVGGKGGMQNGFPTEKQ